MNLTTTAAYALATLIFIAIAPAAFVFARAWWRRVEARREVERLREAVAAIDQAVHDAPEAAVRALQRRFDSTTLDRALEAALRADTGRAAWVAEAYQRLGLTERAIRDVREAGAWAERARAAEVLGLLGVVDAVPALVAALRDPYEDTLSVKVVVAEALARIRDPSVIPLLVKELRVIDEWSSPRVAEALVRFGNAATPPLVELLREDERSAAAVWAARVLGRTGDPAAVPALLERLRDRQDAMRSAAAEALGAIGDRRALQALVQATLRDPIPQVRAQAAGAIGRLGDEDAAEVLIAALGDPDYGTRIRSLEALEMVRPSDTAPMERALRDPRPEVRRRAAQAIERVGYLDARIQELTADDPAVVAGAYAALLELGRAGLVDSLAGYLTRGDFVVRAYVAQVCGEVGSARVAPLLAASVDDPAWPVRARVAEALGRIRQADTAAAVAGLLADPEAVVREAAAAALESFSAADTLPHHDAVRAAFERGSLPVRVSLVEVLARHDRPDTLALLLQAARERSDAVRVRAVAGLGRQPAPEVEPVLEAALRDVAVPVRLAAIDALGARTGDAPVEMLLRALSGASLDVRERISRALAQGDRVGAAFQQRLAKLAASDDRDVRLGASWTLGKLGSPEGIPTLRSLLVAPDPALRASAAGALGKIRDVGSLEALVTAADDREGRVRAAVVNALGRVGLRSPAALSALRGRLHDPDVFVCNRAFLALGRVGGPGAASALEEAAGDERLDPAVRAVGIALAGQESSLAHAIRALAVPSLLRRVRALLTEEDDEVRRTFYARLALEDQDRAVDQTLDVEALVTQYHDLLRASQDPRARRVAVEALAVFRNERSLETLGDALATDPAEEVRLRAAEAVAARVHDQAAGRALARAVTDPSEAVARVVVHALGQSRDRRFADILFQRLGDSPAAVERELVEALALIYQDDPDDLIDQMMGSPRPEVIAAALAVVERMGNGSLLPLLRHLARARAAVVRAAAVRALSSLPAREAAVAVDDARRDPQEEVRLAAIDAIALRGSESAVDRVAALRADPSVAVRRRLAQVLAELTGSAADRLLDGLLQDLSPEVRAAALGTLIARDEPSTLRRFVDAWPHAVPEVAAALRRDHRVEALAERARARLTTDREEPLRRLALEVLVALAPPDLEDGLRDALREPSPAVRIAALEHLARLRPTGVRELIGALLQDPDGGVRARAAHALAHEV